ncbi:hypothetical protein BRADI_4g23455v3 [Brachypodium distachyon]|uniref:Uncharacterized protein n=1 Tax=Brachypodium distachyon TaxID=15368 RepID=A0A0Q3L973_BRADI|nr:hypothetical protein BRADI_4g23455v3 [Brachypodium distachyon]
MGLSAPRPNVQKNIPTGRAKYASANTLNPHNGSSLERCARRSISENWISVKNCKLAMWAVGSKTDGLDQSSMRRRRQLLRCPDAMATRRLLCRRVGDSVALALPSRDGGSAAAALRRLDGISEATAPPATASQWPRWYASVKDSCRPRRYPNTTASCRPRRCRGGDSAAGRVPPGMASDFQRRPRLKLDFRGEF